MNKPREWWVDLHDPQMNSKPAECFIQSGRFIHVIEKSHYDALKAKHEELLSYLPKVPTQTYEKDMAKEIIALKAERDEYVHEAEHFQHKAIDLDQANGILRNELEKAKTDAESWRRTRQIDLDAANAEIEKLHSTIANEWMPEVGKLKLEVERLKNPFNPPEINYGKKVELAEIKLLSPDERLREYFAARTEADSFRNTTERYRVMLAKLLDDKITWSAYSKTCDEVRAALGEEK